MSVSRKLSATLLLATCLCVPVVPQVVAPIGIRPQPPEGKGVMALKAARLIDGTGAAPIANAVLIVTDNKITAVGDARSVQVPAGAKVIDLGDVTLLPGFIDAHTHLVGRVLGDPEGDMSVVRDYESFGAILGVLHARDTKDGPLGRASKPRAMRLASPAATVTKMVSAPESRNKHLSMVWPTVPNRFARPCGCRLSTAQT